MTALPDSLRRYIRMLIVHGTWPSDGEVQMLPLASPASGSSGPTGLSGSVSGPSEPLTSTTPCMSPSLSIPTTHAFGGTYPARSSVALRCGEPMARPAIVSRPTDCCGSRVLRWGRWGRRWDCRGRHPVRSHHLHR